MESRMDKYYNEESREFSRTKKNQDLYKKVYGSYKDLDYLPVSENSSEIDVDKLKEIISSRNDYHKIKREEKVVEEEAKSKNIVEDRSYNINELLEKARNSKPKVVMKNEDIKSYNFLKTLESNQLLKKDIEDAKKEIEEESKEIKNEKKSDNTLSLDILSDLKGDTVVMEPVTDNSKELDDGDSADVEDIPVDKKLKDDEKTFYSGSYKFSSKDFFDEDISKIENNHTFLKVVLVILVLAICAVGVYFLISYLGTR